MSDLADRGLTIFGGNGGGEAFAFDAHGGVVVVPFIGGPEDALPQGRFAEFVRRCAAGTMFEG